MRFRTRSDTAAATHAQSVGDKPTLTAFLPDADKAIKKDILTGHLKRELEQFFHGVVLGSGKTLTMLEWKGGGAALKAIRRSAARHADRDG